MIVGSKNRSFVTIKYVARVCFEFAPRNLKRYSSYVLHQNVENPRSMPPMPPRVYVPVCQKLIISKYSNVTPHFKGNFILFILDHSHDVKSNKNKYFGCFSLFSQSSLGDIFHQWFPNHFQLEKDDGWAESSFGNTQDSLHISKYDSMYLHLAIVFTCSSFSFLSLQSPTPYSHKHIWSQKF